METSRPPRPAYPPEFRARAVELARASALPPSQVACDLGIDPDTLRRWLRQADVDAGLCWPFSLSAPIPGTLAFGLPADHDGWSKRPAQPG